MSPSPRPPRREAGRPASRSSAVPPAAVALLAAGLLFIGSACRRKQAPAAPPALIVEAAPATLRDVPLQVKAIGTVQPISFVQVKALVGGTLLEVGFKEGQDVRTGDLLFRIDPRPFEIAVKQAEAQLARDQAQLKNAEDDVRRYVDLAQKDYVTQEYYEQLVSTAEVQRAVVRGDEAAVDNARLNLGYCLIRSPLDGRTGSLVVHPGNLVKANDVGPLVVINQVRPIYVVFSVPEQNLEPIKRYRAAGPLAVEAYPQGQEKPVAGTLTFIDNAIDTTTGTIPLKATFPNADRALWPGQFVNVVLTLTVEKNALTVPAQAVQTGQNGSYVMVIKKDMTVESRTVEVDRTYGYDSVIRRGLAAGERVVTEGLLRLVPGARVRITSTLFGRTP
jgi:multidrug efflux system membrane fusion protein